jgi:hypothetical protein
MTGRLIPACSRQHIRAFEREINPKIAIIRLRVFAAAMTTTPIHRPPIHWKWVTPPQLVDAEQHGEILHPSSRIHPRNGCFREMLQFRI